MNILEFIGSLEALPASLVAFSRDKSELATQFGLANAPQTLPYDVVQTRILDRAMDGFMAQQILGDPTIAQESFSDYAFVASAIFAAQQVAMRSGLDTRFLKTEYPFFVSQQLDKSLIRILKALNYVPLVVNWWVRSLTPQNYDAEIVQMLELFNSRVIKLNSIGENVVRHIEQALQILSVSEDASTLRFQRAALTPFDGVITDGKIGLLVMPKFGNSADYSFMFSRLKPRLSEEAVVLIYDKRRIVDDCCSTLVAMHQWRGIALKHLAYQKKLSPDDYAILALQANYIPCGD